MSQNRSWLLIVAALVAPSRAADAADARALAARIDHHVAAGWKTAGVEPVALARDA